MSLDLAVIMPVFNEEESITKVIEEWLPQLKNLGVNFKMVILDDGSTDSTPKILETLKSQFAPYVEVIRHSNRGHGQTCIAGYEYALSMSAQWILQIDSDGQCDPIYIEEFWRQRDSNSLIFAYRRQRDDGFSRFLISRVVAFTSWLGSGVWVKDPNVPYRLMKANLLKNVVTQVPKEFYLANILVSLLLRRLSPIKWVPIRFRDRFGGSPSVKLRSFARHGTRLFLHLLKIRSKI
jgi:dolichol-phosphate mannosyltransferase